MTEQSGITKEDAKALAAPFAAKEHEFIRGFIYIEETAICQRIEEIDLCWEWKVVEMVYENGVAAVVGALTIKGITRYGTGQQVAILDKTSGIETVGEARKGATTDAMKRAARLFGIGRYLLQCPKEVKTEGKELNAWLRSLANGSTPAPIAQAAPVIVNETPAPVASKPQPPAWWGVLSEYKPFMPDQDFAHMRDELSQGAKSGSLNITTDDDARAYIERTQGLFIDLDSKRAAAKEAS